MDVPCGVEGCSSPLKGRGLCTRHYQRLMKHGDVETVGSRWTKTEGERFWSHVDQRHECWLWTGATKGGYGVFYVSREGSKRMVQAHRWSYGEVPDSLTVDHLCHTRDESCPGGTASR